MKKKSLPHNNASKKVKKKLFSKVVLIIKYFELKVK
jgi:hypothetical protein